MSDEKQTSPEELCAQALAHYDYVSTQTHYWYSSIPHAIRFWFLEKPKLERELAAAKARIAELEAMRAATYSHVDGRDLLHELQPNGAHHIDIVVRINGQDRRYEGDWLKRLTHARDGHTMGEYADNPKVKAMIDAALAKGKP